MWGSDVHPHRSRNPLGVSTAAEAAQTLADTAKAQAEATQAEANVVRAQAEAALALVEAARAQAENAQSRAEAAQTLAEWAETQAQTAQALADKLATPDKEKKKPRYQRVCDPKVVETLIKQYSAPVYVQSHNVSTNPVAATPSPPFHLAPLYPRSLRLLVRISIQINKKPAEEKPPAAVASSPHSAIRQPPQVAPTLASHPPPSGASGARFKQQKPAKTRQMASQTPQPPASGAVSSSRRESTDARDAMRSYERSLTAAALSPRAGAARSPRTVANGVAALSIAAADASSVAARHASPRAVYHSPHAFADVPPVELATFSPRRRAQKQPLEIANVRVHLGDEDEGKAEEEGDGEVDTLRLDDRKPDAVEEELFASSGDQVKVHSDKLLSAKELEDKGADVPDDNEGCLICMDEFSARRKAYPLPCTGQCTGAFVHYRCIMAWLGQSGSCPLCRGACDPLVLQPMQKLELQDMTKMALQPVPLDAGIIRCYVKQVYRGMFKQYGYELYLQGQIGTQEEDKFLLAARRQVRSNMTANYTICTDKECTDAKRIGRMGSNFLGTCFTLYDNGRDPQKLAKIQDAVSSDDLVGQNVLQIREELGCVTYEPNRTSVGPRKMRVVIPDVDEEGGSSKVVRPMSRQDRLVTRLSTGEMKDLMRFSNREPVFREDLGAYCLDFGGRVSMASVKNFQLISSEDPSMGNILQFGRVADDMFTMDFQWPLSPFQAFSICLSSCDTKLACV